MSLFNLLSVSASGMAAQRTRAEIVVQNLANAETTRTPDGGPYRRQDVVFESQSAASPFESVLAAEMTGVSVSEIRVDTRPGEMRYLPGHPDANKDGYVEMPRVNPAEDMVDLMGASRGYQANVAAMSAVKDMIHKSIELLRS
jgi:flagellar basal-body rod protein FlgC